MRREPVSFPKCAAFEKRKCDPRVFDLTGKRFGRLRVLTYAGYKRPPADSTAKNPIGSILWLCQCDCGERHVYRTSMLRHGGAKSCGCRIQLVTHGLAGTPLHNSYFAMLARCCNPRHNSYPDYGGRGIMVCKRWQGPKGFINFLADMGPRPRNKTLDRRDVNGNYAPYNCRWATNHTQRINQRRHKSKPVASPQADVATITGMEAPF